MTIETDFVATLAAHAPLTSLVGTRIAQNAVDGTVTLPLVVFTPSHAYTTGLNNAVLADQCTLQVQCWAATATDADAVADAVVAALATGLAATAGATVLDRVGSFDADFGYDGTLLTVDWWRG